MLQGLRALGGWRSSPGAPRSSITIPSGWFGTNSRNLTKVRRPQRVPATNQARRRLLRSAVVSEARVELGSDPAPHGDKHGLGPPAVGLTAARRARHFRSIRRSWSGSSTPSERVLASSRTKRLPCSRPWKSGRIDQVFARSADLSCSRQRGVRPRQRCFLRGPRPF